MIYYRIFSKIYERAAKEMCSDCVGFIKKGSKILDLGCGSGIVGKAFQGFFEVELFGVDIEDRRIINLPFQIFDGIRLPFPEKSFDTVLINYVLHHAQDPISLLKEAKRITRDKLIIFEDLPEDILSKIICRLHGVSYSKFFKNPDKTFFRSEKEWEEVFEKIGLKVLFKKRVSSFPIKQQFILGA